MAAVAMVTVHPTHRRRGILTDLMGRLLDGAREAGHPLASLRASEATIYGRFGFGLAGSGVTTEIDARSARPVAKGAEGTFRLVAPDQVLDVVPPLYERAAHRAGAIGRPRWLWQRYLEEAIDPAAPHYVVVHTDASGTDDGYAQYSVSWAGEIGTPGAGRGERQKTAAEERPPGEESLLRSFMAARMHGPLLPRRGESFVLPVWIDAVRPATRLR